MKKEVSRRNFIKGAAVTAAAITAAGLIGCKGKEKKAADTGKKQPYRGQRGSRETYGIKGSRRSKKVPAPFGAGTQFANGQRLLN